MFPWMCPSLPLPHTHTHTRQYLEYMIYQGSVARFLESQMKNLENWVARFPYSVTLPLHCIMLYCFHPFHLSISKRIRLKEHLTDKVAVIWLIWLKTAYGIFFPLKLFGVFVLAHSGSIYENYPNTSQWYMYIIHIILKSNEHFAIASFIIWSKSNWET